MLIRPREPWGKERIIPLVEFKCDKCGIKFEKLFPIGKKCKDKCPECGKSARRIYSPFRHSFTFWYGWDPGLGKYVDTKRQRDNTLAVKGLRKMHD